MKIGGIAVDPKELDRGIIVADRDYFPLLYSFRNSHPELRLKIWSKDDLLSRLTFSFEKGENDPIPHLLKKGITYPNAKRYLSILRIADLSGDPFLSSLKDELENKGLLRFDPLGEREVSRGRLFLFEMQEDLELHGFLKRKKASFADISIHDLGISPVSYPNGHPPIYLFEDKFEQYSYLFSFLRETFLKIPEEKKKSVVLFHDSSDEFFVKLSADLFSVPASFPRSTPMLGKTKIKQKVASIHSSESFLFSEEELQDQELSSLEAIVRHYGLADLPFSFSFASLLDILNSQTDQDDSDAGVPFSSSFLLNPSQTFFVTNFQYGDFYSVFGDKGPLSDQELLSVGCNPSYVQTKLDRRKKLNFLLYNKIAFLSRTAKHLNDKIYDSPFLKELGWEESVEKKNLGSEGSFTEASEKIYRADLLDSLFVHHPCDGLMGYDHSFKKVEGRELWKKENWSVSNLERYLSCPFRFLLERYLPSSKDRNLRLGSLNHKMMESLYREDYDFDSLFLAAAKEYRDGFEKDGIPFNGEEEVILKIYGFWLRKIISAIRKSKEEGFFPKEISEASLTWTLKDEDGEEYHFSGRVDKLLFVQSGAKSYYLIADYKTGQEAFKTKNVFLGPCTQLPMYALALREEQNAHLTKGATFAGFGNQHTYVSSFSKIGFGEKVADDLPPSYFAFRGPLLKDADLWGHLDKSGFKKKGDGLKSAGGKFFKPSGWFLSEKEGSLLKDGKEYTMEELLSDAKKAVLDTIKAIKGNHFPIAPTSNDLSKKIDSLACRLCSYGDICYKNVGLDARSYTDEIKAHFASDEVEEDEED